MAFEHDDDIVLVDCGTRFSSDDCGIDVIHPDFRWLETQRSRVRGVVLTHGHEDHIGALPYLLRELNVPLYGPRHALRLIAQRLERHGFDEDEVAYTTVEPRQRFLVGSMEFEPIRVSHSIMDATALCVRTRAGTVLHTGDFKFDPAPSDGETTDEARLAEIADEGVDLLLSDSTNIDETGAAGSESQVREHLMTRVESAPERVIVVLFASNVQRLISLGKVALATGRRIVALGTSLNRHIEIARELGALDFGRDLVLSPERARTYPRRELLVLASGTQAEPGSAMWRLARQDHRFLDLHESDRIIFSSRVIPGRERQVHTMICDLLRMGAEVEWGRRSGAHTSGHACRDEQARMIGILRPRNFMPVHGTLHHLLAHGRLARDAGVDHVHVVENGQSVVLQNGRVHLGEVVPHGEIAIGQGGEVLTPDDQQCRRDLARGGQLTVAASCDRRGRLLGAPTLRVHGVPLLVPGERLAKELVHLLENEWGTVRRHSLPEIEVEVQKLVEKWLNVRHRLEPVVTVVLVQGEGKAR
jgi:ribonuclease J